MKKKKTGEETIIIPEFNFDGWMTKSPTAGEKIELMSLEEAKSYLLDSKEEFPVNTIDLSDIDIENLTEKDKQIVADRLGVPNKDEYEKFLRVTRTL
ncbi:MAG: hypothetical protein CSA15_01385 [Candidatus Delongbacteria bacterium]|nr:MAG: hypothetical protein CSA15_01385 [Candidatus Delongbacteria bacterium]